MINYIWPLSWPWCVFCVYDGCFLLVRQAFAENCECLILSYKYIIFSQFAHQSNTQKCEGWYCAKLKESFMFQNLWQIGKLMQYAFFFQVFFFFKSSAEESSLSRSQLLSSVYQEVKGRMCFIVSVISRLRTNAQFFFIKGEIA